MTTTVTTMMLLYTALLLAPFAAALNKSTTEPSSRIVGGQAIFTEGRFPYFAHVNICFRNNPTGCTTCGGTLIAPRAVLTAAHCVNAYDQVVSVDFGKLTVEDDSSSVQTFEVESIALHPSFYQFQYIHDIAVLRLKEPVLSITPALVPFGRKQLPQKGQLVTAMGFGLREELQPSERLRQVLIQVQSPTDCDIYNWGVNVTRQFCAGETGKVPCSGDSGGPAMVGTRDGDMISGLVSYGGFDCFSFPAVFTRVSAYEDFIMGEVCSNGDNVNLPEWCQDFIVIGTQVNCFAGSSLVQVEDSSRRAVAMQDLQLNDRVLVGNGVYEPIYSFGHLSRESQGSFLQISTEKMATTPPLLITPDHMVFTQSRGAVPALLLKEGDFLLREGTGLDRITAIQTVQGRGMYAPFTPSGKLVVDGVLASSYVSLNQKEGLEILGGLFTLSHQWLGHTMMFPHRLVCHHLGSCTSERYNPEGISLWVLRPLELSQWMVKSSGSLSFFLTSTVALLACLFVVLEFLVVHPVLLLVVVAMAMTTHRYRLQCCKRF